MPAYKDEKKGTYYVSFYYTDYTGAKRKKLKRGFERKRDAQEWERKFLLQKTADLNMTFGAFVEIYYVDKQERIREHTWISKRNIIETKILPYFKDRVISEIEPRDIITWQNEIMKQRKPDGTPFAPGYLKTIHAEISCIFNHAVRYYRLQSNPAAVAGNMGHESHQEMLFWTKEEYLKFAAVMMNKLTMYYAFEVLYWCGVRMGEMLALTPEDFDFEKQTLRINKSYQRLNGKDVITEPKTPKSIRTIRMNKALADEMKDYIRSFYHIGPKDRIFTMSDNALHYQMEQGAKRAGVKKIRIHDLRHPYVKLKTNISLKQISNFVDNFKSTIRVDNDVINDPLRQFIGQCTFSLKIIEQLLPLLMPILNCLLLFNLCLHCGKGAFDFGKSLI